VTFDETIGDSGAIKKAVTKTIFRVRIGYS
jgi:hypothetical protein